MKLFIEQLRLNCAVGLLLGASLVACGGSGGSKKTPVELPPEPATPQLVIAIDSGNFGSATYDGVTYGADRFFSGGSANSTTDTITNSDGQPALFQTERYGSYSYEIPVTRGSYTIHLHFTELYQTEAGKRSFDVLVEDQATEISQFDLFATAGHDSAYSVTVENVLVTDGNLSIKLVSHIDNATLAGFAVYSIDGKFIEPPPPPPPAAPSPSPATAENLGSDCELGEYPAESTNAKLPDPFKNYEGERITTKDEWRCQRQALLRLAEHAIYGEKPAKPEQVTATLDGNKIQVTVEHNGKSASFAADISRPANASGTIPAVIGISGFGAWGLPVTQAAEEGVATIILTPYEVGAESGSRSNKQGAFYTLYGADSSSGLLVAWSWGVSRLIDALEILSQSETPAMIDADKLGVFGCSRFGKAAFTIGAFDQRIKLTLPLESGSGGVPMWRGLAAEGAQSAISAYGETYWLGDAFAPYTANINKLPIDTHAIIGLIAPRGLFIMDNPHIANLGPKSAHVAAVAGAEIYKALDAENNITYHSNVASGSHCEFRAEHTAPFKAHLQKFLKDDSTAVTGGIDPHPTATGDASRVMDWSAPVLE